VKKVGRCRASKKGMISSSVIPFCPASYPMCRTGILQLRRSCRWITETFLSKRLMPGYALARARLRALRTTCWPTERPQQSPLS